MKKKMRNRKKAEIDVNGVMRLYAVLKEKLSIPTSVSISARDFQFMTGLPVDSRVKLVWFTPDPIVDKPGLYTDGRLVIPGQEFLAFLESHKVDRPCPCGSGHLQHPDTLH